VCCNTRNTFVVAARGGPGVLVAAVVVVVALLQRGAHAVLIRPTRLAAEGHAHAHARAHTHMNATGGGGFGGGDRVVGGVGGGVVGGELRSRYFTAHMTYTVDTMDTSDQIGECDSEGVVCASTLCWCVFAVVCALTLCWRVQTLCAGVCLQGYVRLGV